MTVSLSDYIRHSHLSEHEDDLVTMWNSVSPFDRTFDNADVQIVLIFVP